MKRRVVVALRMKRCAVTVDAGVVAAPPASLISAVRACAARFASYFAAAVGPVFQSAQLAEAGSRAAIYSTAGSALQRGCPQLQRRRRGVVMLNDSKQVILLRKVLLSTKFLKIARIIAHQSLIVTFSSIEMVIKLILVLPLLPKNETLPLFFIYS